MSVLGVNPSAINSLSSFVMAPPIITDEVSGGNTMLLFSDVVKEYGEPSSFISVGLVSKKWILSFIFCEVYLTEKLADSVVSVSLNKEIPVRLSVSVEAVVIGLNLVISFLGISAGGFVGTSLSDNCSTALLGVPIFASPLISVNNKLTVSVFSIK